MENQMWRWNQGALLWPHRDPLLKISQDLPIVKVHKTLNSLAFLSTSQPFQLCTTVHTSCNSSLHVSSVHIVLLLLHVLFYLFMLFDPEETSSSFFLFMGFYEKVFTGISLPPPKPSSNGGLFLPQNQEIILSVDALGKPLLFLWGCIPKLLWWSHTPGEWN